MPLWNGPTWTCHECDGVNATIRTRCRFCKAEMMHPDPVIQSEIAADCREGRASEEPKP